MGISLLDKSIYYILSFFILVFYSLTNIIPHLGSFVLALIFLLMLIQLIKDKKKISLEKNEKIFLYLIFFYLLMHMTSLIYNGGLLNRFEMRLSRIDQELRLLLILPFAFFINYKKIERDYFYFGLIFGSIISFGFSISQILSGSLRAKGSYHTISFADISILIGFLSFFTISYFYGRKKIMVIFPILGLFCGIVAAVLSGSRGAFLAFPVFIITALIKYRKNLLIYFMVIAALFSIYLGDKITNNTLLTRYYEVYENVLTLNEDLKNNRFLKQERLEIWRAAFIIIKQYPISGVGQKGFKKQVEKLVKENVISNRIKRHGDPHNQILYDIVSNGIIGGVACLSIFLFPIIIFIKKIEVDSDVSYMGIVFILSMFLFAMTETIFTRNIFITFFIITISFLFNILKDSKKELI